VSEGTTLLLTTQYLDEADHLADQIVVLDQGRVAAAGSPAQLKKRVGGGRIEVVFREAADLAAGQDVIWQTARGSFDVDQVERRITIPVTDGPRSLVRIAGALDAAGLEVEDLGLRQPTLDEVFLAVTT
ncbi:MAG: DUF4162 domain-containing protein, partial [Nonomuraea sp.]|nr:DUF4162 domain-containing protein [Nonomuraea sp.]